jgi:hypothetical protein
LQKDAECRLQTSYHYIHNIIMVHSYERERERDER